MHRQVTIYLLLFWETSVSGCVRAGYENLQHLDSSTLGGAGDGVVIGGETGAGTDGGTGTGSADADQVNQVPVATVITKDNQSCATAAEIDGATIHQFANAPIKVQLDPAGAIRSNATCLSDLAPFILRVLNAPATIFVTCNFSGDLDFVSTRMVCTLTNNQIIDGECFEVTPSSKGGDDMALNQTNYLLLCRHPDQGPAIIELSGLPY